MFCADKANHCSIKVRDLVSQVKELSELSTQSLIITICYIIGRDSNGHVHGPIFGPLYIKF